MIFYLINMGFKYTGIIFDFFIKGDFFTSPVGILFILISLYGASMGAFYLAYCIVWRQFEKDQEPHFKKAIIFNLAAIIIPLIDLFLIIKYNFASAYVFFAVMVVRLQLLTAR